MFLVEWVKRVIVRQFKSHQYQIQCEAQNMTRLLLGMGRRERFRSRWSWPLGGMVINEVVEGNVRQKGRGHRRMLAFSYVSLMMVVI